MANLTYLDFDLQIARASGGYRAEVRSPVGQGAVDFGLPFSDLEVENLLLRVGRTRRGTRRLESPEMQAAKVFGGRLFEAVFAGDVRGCFRASLDEAKRQEIGLRVRLHLADAPELADLPWEYLHNSGLNRFLSLSAETPVVRYLPLGEPIRPLRVKPPLRILAVISSPTDYPPLEVEREWTKLGEALADLQARGQVALERLDEATLAALQRRLRRGEYHILHFIGHGGFDANAEDGVLVLENEQGRANPVSGQYLGTLLHDHRPLRLAVLNACEGARASRSDPFAGSAQSLVQQGIPAVIAMQFEITDEAAITLSHEFYAALAEGYPVDAALTEARRAIFASGNDVEWGTPVLYMRSPDGRIFDVEPMSEEERRKAAASLAAVVPDAAPAPARSDVEAATRPIWRRLTRLSGGGRLVGAVALVGVLLLSLALWPGGPGQGTTTTSANAAATPQPTAAQESQPSPAAASPTLPPTVAAATTTASPLPVTPTLSAEGEWEQLEASIAGWWDSDRVRVIAGLRSYRAKHPDHAAGRDKLYSALVNYGDELVGAGQPAEAARAWEEAAALRSSGSEARERLAALTPTPLPRPTTPPTAPRPPPTASAPAPPPPTAPVVVPATPTPTRQLPTATSTPRPATPTPTPTRTRTPTPTSTVVPGTCISGYVWREAVAGDRVCVTPPTRSQAAFDNSQASARVQPGGGAYGPATCRQGYVWREATPSDLVCVTPQTRTQTRADNQAAPSRVVR